MSSRPRTVGHRNFYYERVFWNQCSAKKDHVWHTLSSPCLWRAARKEAELKNMLCSRKLSKEKVQTAVTGQCRCLKAWLVSDDDITGSRWTWLHVCLLASEVADDDRPSGSWRSQIALFITGSYHMFLIPGGFIFHYELNMRSKQFIPNNKNWNI